MWPINFVSHTRLGMATTTLLWPLFPPPKLILQSKRCVTAFLPSIFSDYSGNSFRSEINSELLQANPRVHSPTLLSRRILSACLPHIHGLSRASSQSSLIRSRKWDGLEVISCKYLILTCYEGMWYNSLIGFGFRRLVVPNTGLVVTRDAKTAYVSTVSCLCQCSGGWRAKYPKARLAYAADTADQKVRKDFAVRQSIHH